MLKFTFLQDTNDDCLYQVQGDCVNDEQLPSSKLMETSDYEPVAENVKQNSMEVISDTDTLLQNPPQVCQAESTLDLETQIQVENRQEQSESVFEMNTSHNITVDPFKAESKNTVDLDVKETEVEKVVKKQEETVGNITRTVNGALPNSTQVAPKQPSNLEENNGINEGGIINSQVDLLHT